MAALSILLAVSYIGANKMTLEQIKTSIDQGKKVYWKNLAYDVIKDKIGQYLIVCNLNNYTIGLTWLDGITMNGEESDFFNV